jgi:hypothetical protein
MNVTESILNFLIDIVVWLLDFILSLLPSPPTLQIPVPQLFADLLSDVFGTASQFLLPMFLWFIGRQIWFK